MILEKRYSVYFKKKCTWSRCLSSVFTVKGIQLESQKGMLLVCYSRLLNRNSVPLKYNSNCFQKALQRAQTEGIPTFGEKNCLWKMKVKCRNTPCFGKKTCLRRAILLCSLPLFALSAYTLTSRCCSPCRTRASCYRDSAYEDLSS